MTEVLYVHCAKIFQLRKCIFVVFFFVKLVSIKEMQRHFHTNIFQTCDDQSDDLHGTHDEWFFLQINETKRKSSINHKILFQIYDFVVT